MVYIYFLVLLHTLMTSVPIVHQYMMPSYRCPKLCHIYTDSRNLKLCPEKCGVLVTAPPQHEHTDFIEVDGMSLPVEKSVKCLGMWLSSDQSSKKSVEENIRKAHGAFFARGQLGIFHGMLNPLSSRSTVIILFFVHLNFS